MKSNKVIRVGIIGGGAISQRRHLPEYAANPNAEIVGLYDALPSRAQELATLYGCKAYESPEALIADETIDAISICSPNVTHADYTIKALKAGKHALCEKPMAVSLACSLLSFFFCIGRVLISYPKSRTRRTGPSCVPRSSAAAMVQGGAMGRPVAGPWGSFGQFRLPASFMASMAASTKAAASGASRGSQPLAAVT